MTDNVVPFHPVLGASIQRHGRRYVHRAIGCDEPDCPFCKPVEAQITKPETPNLRYPTISELRPCGICGGLPIAVTKANDLQCMACGAISQTHEVNEVKS